MNIENTKGKQAVGRGSLIGWSAGLIVIKIVV